MWKFLAWLSLFLVAVNAAQYVIPRAVKPKGRFDFVYGCYLPDLDTVIPVDEISYPSPKCEAFFCKQAGLITIVDTCPVYYFEDPSCLLVEGDPTKKYPDCCATVYCSNPNAIYTVSA